MSMRIGICQWSIPVSEPEECLSLAAELGLEGVEPDLGRYEDGFPLTHKIEQVKYKLWRERYGIVYPALAVNALCQYGMSDAASKSIAETAIAKAVDTAVALSIPIVQLPSFVKGDITSPAGYQNTIKCLQYACQYAEGSNVIIGSENALPADQPLEMIKAISSKHFRIYFDTRNLFSMKGLDSVSILKTLLPYICEIHIKDGIDNGPASLLGEGNSGFFDSIQVLKDHNYSGWLLLENSYAAMAQDSQIPAGDLLRTDIEIVRGCL